MASLVEGDWKEFVFKMVVVEDIPAIYAHLRKYWYPDEIMGKYAGVDEAYINDFEHLCKLAFAEDLSFIAWHKESNEIASIRLTFTSRKDSDLIAALSITSKGFKKTAVLVGELDKQSNLYERYGIDYLANFLLASTATKYRGKGLATEMYRRSISLLKSKGFPLCKSAFSSPFTRKAVRNLGFTEVARVYLKDFKDEDGEPNFKGAADEDCTATLCLQL